MAVKVLLALTSAELGGAERVVLDILEHVPAEAYRFHVLLPRYGRIVPLLEGLGVSYEILAFGASMVGMSRSQQLGFGLRKVWTLARELWIYERELGRVARRFGAGLIYSHGLKAEFLTAAYKLWGGIPVVWHLHTFPPSLGLLGLAYRFAARIPEGIIANSTAVARSVPRLAQRKTQVVYAGVDTQRFAPMNRAEAAVRLGLKLEPQERFVGMISVLAPWKGVDLFLRAVAPLLGANPEWRAVVVGDVLYDTAGHSAYREQLRSLAAELGVAERVLFLPFQLDPAPAYSLLDIFVHASKAPEPFGRVIGEAMSTERAVIASAGGGALEQITSEADGILAAMNDEGALRSAMERLMNDPARRAQLGKAARASIKARFSLEGFAAGVRQALALGERSEQGEERGHRKAA